jgi:hypothetical protein
MCLRAVAVGAIASGLVTAAIADGYDKGQARYKPVVREKVVEKVREVEVVEHRSYMAHSLAEVTAVNLKGSICDREVREELRDAGIPAGTSGGNAYLDLDMAANGSLRDTDSIEKGVYVARLIGANGRVLFETSGRESGHDREKLCADIGDTIADRLEDRIG